MKFRWIYLEKNVSRYDTTWRKNDKSAKYNYVTAKVNRTFRLLAMNHSTIFYISSCNQFQSFFGNFWNFFSSRHSMGLLLDNMWYLWNCIEDRCWKRSFKHHRECFCSLIRWWRFEIFLVDCRLISLNLIWIKWIKVWRGIVVNSSFFDFNLTRYSCWILFRWTWKV